MCRQEIDIFLDAIEGFEVLLDLVLCLYEKIFERLGWGGGSYKVKHVVHVIDITCLNPLHNLSLHFVWLFSFFNRVWKQTAMALKPLLKSKVDELFARWLSDPETQLNLKENLRQLCQGESITLQHLTSPKSSSKQSPRLRPSSPPYSPNSTKLPNPRSPRRALSNKNKANNGSPRVSLIYIIFFLLSELIYFDVF